MTIKRTMNIKIAGGVIAAIALIGSTDFASTQPAANRASLEVTEYRNPKYGFTMRVPADVFEPGVTRNTEAGNLWISRDKQARLVAAAQINVTGESLQSYRKFLMAQNYPGATFDYTPLKDTWFVMSGVDTAGNMFYERVTFACEGRYIYGWQLSYPVGERQRYDRVVEAIHRGYRVGNGEYGSCSG